MSFVLPAQLSGLTEREAIADALYRGVLAFDHADESLLLSAVTDDIHFEMPGTSVQGFAAVKEAVFDRVSKLGTTHFLTNLRIAIDSPTAAKVTCTSTAQHVRVGKGFEPGPHKFTSGGFYACDVVKVGDLWKIKSWWFNIVWVGGNASVMTGE